MIKPELLAPAGNLEKLKTAILYGADAVYVGGEEFSLRTACDNFTDDELKYGIDFAKNSGKNIYVAANVILKNKNIEEFTRFVQTVNSYGADAIIISDLGALEIVKNIAPKLDIHISTQANTVNYVTAEMWHKLGAKRVVLARELSQMEIKEVRQRTSADLELEAFVHGAMCVSYSGRCLLSNYMTGRDANQGECAQPCRWKYYLVEEKRPNQYIPVFENENGSYFFNSKDLCLIQYIPQLIECGISSFKVEGRVKSEYYVATVVKAYRQEIDRYLENPSAYTFDTKQMEELRKVSHREYSTGFWEGRPQNTSQIYENNSYIRDYDVVGIVKSCEENGIAKIEQKNKFCVGDVIEIMQPNEECITMTITDMYNKRGEKILEAPHAQMVVTIKLPSQVPENSMVRKAREQEV